MTAILGSIQNARKTKAAWDAQNPILLNGQIVGELDSGKTRFKQGDGVTAYTSLPYASVSDADIEAFGDTLYYRKSVVDGMFADAVKAPVAIDCSTNPNYPAASKGTSYKVSVAGKIGGVSGVNVGVGDLMIASVTTAAGTHAAVGANWGIYETNIDKATEAVFGTARRATSAELTAGSDDVAFVTSAKLRVAADARFAAISHAHTFASLTSKPTTLSGFGITDALPLSGGTLTGALTGTSATFSDGITANGNIASSTDLIMQTSGVERMRITSVGNLRLGVTPALDTNIEWMDSSVLGITGRIWADGNPRLNASCGSNGVYLSNGATSWASLSDIRLKTITGNIESAVERLSTLRTVNFSWKNDKTNKPNMGLIAQDVKAVFPEIVDQDKDGIMGVRYTELIPVLIKAIQELKSELDSLKAGRA